MTETEAKFIINATGGVLLSDIAKIVTAYVRRGWHIENLHRSTAEEKDACDNAFSRFTYDYGDENNTTDTILFKTDHKSHILLERVVCTLASDRLVVTQILNADTIEKKVSVDVKLPVACKSYNVPERWLDTLSQESHFRYYAITVKESAHGKNYAVVIDFKTKDFAVFLLQHTYDLIAFTTFRFNDMMTHLMLSCDSTADDHHFYTFRLADLSFCDHVRHNSKIFITPDGAITMLQVHTYCIKIYSRRDRFWQLLDSLDVVRDVSEKGGLVTVIRENIMLMRDNRPVWTIKLFESYGSKNELPDY